MVWPHSWSEVGGGAVASLPRHHHSVPMAEAPAPTEAGQVKVSIAREKKGSTLFGCFTCCMSQHEQEATDAFDRHANTTVSSTKHPKVGGRRMSVNEFGARRGDGTRPRAHRRDSAMTSLSTLALLSLAELFLHRHAELWAMIGVNLGLSDERCKAIAARVAMGMYGQSSSEPAAAPAAPGLASAATSASAADATMSREE